VVFQITERERKNQYPFQIAQINEKKLKVPQKWHKETMPTESSPDGSLKR